MNTVTIKQQFVGILLCILNICTIKRRNYRPKIEDLFSFAWTVDREPSLWSPVDHGPSLLYGAEVWLGKLTDGGQAPGEEEDLKAFGAVASAMIAPVIGGGCDFYSCVMFLVYSLFRLDFLFIAFWGGLCSRYVEITGSSLYQSSY